MGFFSVIIKTIQSNKEGMSGVFEHSEYRWLTFEDAKSMLSIPGTGDVLSFIEDHFVYKKPKNFLRIEVEECSL